jgi:hypothetical protein
MRTARQFMETFLREQEAYIALRNQRHRALNEKFYSEECLEYPWIGYRTSAFEESLLSVDDSGNSALAPTTGNDKPHRRYHLRVCDGKWEIHKWDEYCWQCEGMGRLRGQTCIFCNGCGWFNLEEFAKSGRLFSK